MDEVNSTNEENVEELKAKQEELETEEQAQDDQVDEYKEKFLYLAAEFENARKRFAREKEQLLKFGQENILKDLLGILDNFDRVLEATANETDQKVKNIIAGVEMVRGDFLKTVDKYGLSTVSSEGEFDPNLHEAMGQEELEGVESNHITKVFEKGYSLNGRLIRAAKVMVAK